MLVPSCGSTATAEVQLRPRAWTEYCAERPNPWPAACDGAADDASESSGWMVGG